MADVNQFVADYTSSRDRARIAFAWNRKHADQFKDANYEFRSRVLKRTIAQLKTAPLDLVCDLYDAETAWAKESWCVNFPAVRALAEELLTRGGPDYVEDFLTGKIGRGMDAFCSASFDCPRALAERLLAEVELRLAGAEGDRRALLEVGRDVFSGWIENAPA